MTPSDDNKQPYAQHRFLGRMSLTAGPPPNQFLLYNHVGDYYYYGPDGLMFLPMRDTLIAYLQRNGYQIIAIYNITEGLLFADELGTVDGPAMRKEYRNLTTKPRAKNYPSPTVAGGSAASAAGAPAEAAEPPVLPRTPEQQPVEVIADLGALLRQNRYLNNPPVRSAVIIERLQNLVGATGSLEERRIVDQLQSWSGVMNGNVSILIADVATLEALPQTLVGSQRSGIVSINVGLPSQSELDQVFTSAYLGRLAKDFGDTVGIETDQKVYIHPLQRRGLKNRLESCDIRTLHGYFKECIRRNISELTLRTLLMISTQTIDVWPSLLTSESLTRLRGTLHERIKGQEFALNRFIDELELIADTVNDRIEQDNQGGDRLLGYFFFAGPTGVGKTEVFRVLKEEFPTVHMRQINMPEYQHEHTVARFFGAPPGYIGHGRGELGQFLIEHPATIILFDEFEKAHRRVWENFLTMLEGGLTTGDGIKVDLSQAIFIFTSNAGVVLAN